MAIGGGGDRVIPTPAPVAPKAPTRKTTAPRKPTPAPPPAPTGAGATATDPSGWAAISAWLAAGGDINDPQSQQHISEWLAAGSPATVAGSPGAVNADGSPTRPSSDATPIPPGGPTGTTTGGGAASGPDRTVYGQIASYLNSLGLGSLISVGPDGQPAGWLWEQMQNGAQTADEIKLAVEGTEAWQTRFAVIVAQRKLAAEGKPTQVMSVNDVVNYENTAAQVMRQNGLPSWMYDQPSDFNNLMISGVSTAELNQRITQGYSLVAQADPLVRQAFDSFYGVGAGDDALAAFFLDPEHTMAAIDKAERTAYTAGMASKFGMTFDRSTADRVTGLTTSDAQALQGLQQLNRESAVFNQGAAEGAGPTAANEGVASVFGQDGAATDSIQRRLSERGAGGVSPGGGATSSQAGFAGVRSV